MTRFTWKTEKLQHLDDEVLMVVDNENKDWKGHILNIVDMLNELNDERMMYKTTIDKRIVELKEENEQLRKIGVMYQGHNPCETCTYCLENKVCCAEPVLICDDAKKNFIQGLCKKHKQFQKFIRRYDDE